MTKLGLRNVLLQLLPSAFYRRKTNKSHQKLIQVIKISHSPSLCSGVIGQTAKGNLKPLKGEYKINPPKCGS